MELGKLVFYAANGVASTRFTTLRMQNGRAERRGAFLFDSSITHVLSEVDLDVTSKVWRFMRQGDTPPLADKMRLLPNRKLDGYSYPNEASWDYDGAADKLVFLSASGTVSTRFGEFSAEGGVMRFSGRFQFDPLITHVLEEVGPGWSVGSTYVAWLPRT